MSGNETINNFLYDEENEYTQSNDMWDDLIAKRRDEIDERRWAQADALSHRNDLNRQVSDMLNRVLTDEEENEVVRLYFGIGRRRHTPEELAILFDDGQRVNELLRSALEKLRFSDEILAIYKYLYK